MNWWLIGSLALLGILLVAVYKTTKSQSELEDEFIREWLD